MDKNIYSFSEYEADHIADILKEIYVVCGVKDTIVEDFITALENADCIEITEDRLVDEF